MRLRFLLAAFSLFAGCVTEPTQPQSPDPSPALSPDDRPGRPTGHDQGAQANETPTNSANATSTLASPFLSLNESHELHVAIVQIGPLPGSGITANLYGENANCFFLLNVTRIVNGTATAHWSAADGFSERMSLEVRRVVLVNGDPEQPTSFGTVAEAAGTSPLVLAFGELIPDDGQVGFAFAALPGGMGRVDQDVRLDVVLSYEADEPRKGSSPESC